MPVAAQKRYNVWAFGTEAGINFNGGAAPTGATKVYGNFPPFYTSSVCDEQGNLLFYTDGFTLWNAAHKEIPKVQSRWPWSGLVMPLICPYPGNDSLYYLFGVSAGSYANRLQYLTVNMSTAAGKIVYPPIVTSDNYYTVLMQNASVALAGTMHCNEKDTWIVTHSDGAFHAFLLSAGGVSPGAVVSPVSELITGGAMLQTGYGNLKFSANGEKLLLPLPFQDKVVVFDFDNGTGKVTGAVEIPVAPGLQLEDAELSADGSMLYMAAFETLNPTMASEVHYLHQMDLDAGDGNAVIQSRYAVSGYGDAVLCSPRTCISMHRTLQMGPDGKIYVAMRDRDKTLSIIESPNVKGSNCRYRKNALDLRRTYQLINYNYIRSGSFSLRQNGIQIQAQTCTDQPARFSLLYSRIDSVKWDFGDPQSGSRNFATSLNPAHLYPGPGTYTARAVIYKNCITDTAEKTVVVNTTPGVRLPASLRDTVICIGQTPVLNATAANATSYTWENGLIFPERTFEKSGVYTVKAYNECSFDERTINVAFKECPCKVFVPSAFTPDGNGRNDGFRPSLECYSDGYEFTIFNRYGGIEFRSTTAGAAWTGFSGTKAAPAGLYLWTLRYRNPNTGKEIFERGTVMLIR